MEISFTYLPEDIMAYHRDWETYRKSKNSNIRPKRRLIYIVYYFALVIVPLAAFIGIGLLNVTINWAFFGMVGTAVVWRFLLDRIWRYWNVKRALKKPNLQGNHIIKLLPQGLSGSTTQGEYLRYWTNYADIALASHHILFVFENGSMTPIPRRAFPEVSAAEAFFQEAVHYWKSSAWPPSPQSTV